MYRESTTASHADCAPLEIRKLVQPHRNPASGPKASRINTYWPPVDGMAAPSSAHASAPKNETTPAKIQIPRIQAAEERFCAIRFGTRKTPAPITQPITIESASTRPSARGSSVFKESPVLDCRIKAW